MSQYVCQDKTSVNPSPSLKHSVNTNMHMFLISNQSAALIMSSFMEVKGTDPERYLNQQQVKWGRGLSSHWPPQIYRIGNQLCKVGSNSWLVAKLWRLLCIISVFLNRIRIFICKATGVKYRSIIFFLVQMSNIILSKTLFFNKKSGDLPCYDILSWVHLLKYIQSLDDLRCKLSAVLRFSIY